MIFASQYSPNAAPLGSTQRGNSLPGPQWVMADGRAVNRADYPRASANFPVGRLTGTLRALAATPGNISNTPMRVNGTGTHFMTNGSGTTQAVQYSADGVTWNNATTPPATIVLVFGTPTRNIALCSSAIPPIVSATADPSSAWSSTSVGPSTVATFQPYNRGTYAAGLSMAVIVSANGLYTLAEGATTWVIRSPAGTTRTSVCWTGLNILSCSGASAVIDLSADAAAWSTVTLPEATTSNNGAMCSDGNGRVVLTGVPSGILLSKDHGVTWKFVQIPGIVYSDSWKAQFSGGYFMIPTAVGLAVSIDGEAWFVDRTTVQPFNVSTGVARKGTTIAQAGGSGTVVYSYAESTTQFNMPYLQSFTTGPGNVIIPDFPTFMRMR